MSATSENEESQNYTNFITNTLKSDSGTKFWSANFPGQKTIPYSTFSNVFFKCSEVPVSDEFKSSFKNLIAVDGGEEGSVVNIEQFGKLIAWFAPFELPFKENGFLDRIANLLKQPFFHGFMSASQAAEMLRSNAPSSLLVRFSSSLQGGYAISTLDADSKVFHYRVWNEPEKGFYIKGGENPVFYKTIPELLGHPRFRNFQFCTTGRQMGCDIEIT